MAIASRPIHRTPNPYANPDGRKNPHELNRDKPDIMTLANQDRKVVYDRRPSGSVRSSGSDGVLGPALYEVGFGETPLPILVQIKPGKP